MNEAEREPAPRLSPVRRYYNDIRYVSDGDTAWADMQFSVDRLLADELHLADDALANLRGILTPTAVQYVENPRWGRDQFMRVPLEIVSPWIDIMATDEELEKWYGETISQIEDLTEGTHTHSCYLVPDGRNALCSRSPLCPRRTLSTVLQMPVRTPDFDNLNYTTDPYRSRAVALKKMEIARNANMISSVDSTITITRFSAAFERRFSMAPRPDENRA